MTCVSASADSNWGGAVRRRVGTKVIGTSEAAEEKADGWGAGARRRADGARRRDSSRLG